MDLSVGMSALLLGASMDPLEAVLGPFPCVCLRGLPFEASLEDVLCFFQGLVVLDVVVTGSVPIDGHGGGEAFVVFANPMDFQMALQR
jgi:heterogeneous nuclear ribonucleoprotein F/H